MQLSKLSHYEENSLFAEPLLNQISPTDPQSNVSFLQPFPKVDHEQQTPQRQELPLLDQTKQVRFYQEFKKIYTVSYHLHLEKKRQFEVFDKLTNKIKDIQDKMKDSTEKEIRKGDNDQQSRIKRARRTAEMIEKKYRCSVTYCQRLYGSEGSLQQHIKLKHPQLYQASGDQDLDVNELNYAFNESL